MTEEFGPIGIGWRFTELDRWTQDGPDGEVMCFVRVGLQVAAPQWVDDEWSFPIEGIGGSKLVEMEKNGLHANDEGWKMATTDALGTACKYIGLAADIYMGGKGPSGSKYEARTKAPPNRATAAKASDLRCGATEAAKRHPSVPPVGGPAPVEEWNEVVIQMWSEIGARKNGEPFDDDARDETGRLITCPVCQGPCKLSKSDRGKKFWCKANKANEDPVCTQGKYSSGWWGDGNGSWEQDGPPYKGRTQEEMPDMPADEQAAFDAAMAEDEHLIQ
jgi:hypothetical protein